MSLAGCSNLNAWVRDLDKKVEAVLAKRLEKVRSKLPPPALTLSLYGSLTIPLLCQDTLCVVLSSNGSGSEGCSDLPCHSIKLASMLCTQLILLLPFPR